MRSENGESTLLLGTLNLHCDTRTLHRVVDRGPRCFTHGFVVSHGSNAKFRSSNGNRLHDRFSDELQCLANEHRAPTIEIKRSAYITIRRACCRLPSGWICSEAIRATYIRETINAGNQSEEVSFGLESVAGRVEGNIRSFGDARAPRWFRFHRSFGLPPRQHTEDRHKRFRAILIPRQSLSIN